MWRSYGHAIRSVARGDFKKLVKTVQKLNMNYPTMMPDEYEVVPMPKARGWSRKGSEPLLLAQCEPRGQSDPANPENTVERKYKRYRIALTRMP
jgi:hypothetical protein